MTTSQLTSGGTTLALSQNWLDCQTSGLAASVQQNSLSNYQNYVNGYPTTYWGGWTYPVYVSSPARPIKLTLSEIDRLRKAAKADDKIKAILAKFTDQIEITVDFE